jgi:hypothetical protein
MGREAKCSAVIGKWKGEGKVLLETDDLIFRGENRLVVPRAAISAATEKDGWLEIMYAGGRARFEVGPAAHRWVHDILNPKSRIDKMDVRADSHVATVSMRDAAFVDEVRARAGKVATRLGAGPYDIVFYRADEPAALERLADLRQRIRDTGAVWIVTPKGRPELGHAPVVAAARNAGLVDVKTARFSETHTALKLVIPKAQRLKQGL